MRIRSVHEGQIRESGGFGDKRSNDQVNSVYVRDGVSVDARTGAVDHDALFMEALMACGNDREDQHRQQSAELLGGYDQERFTLRRTDDVHVHVSADQAYDDVDALYDMDALHYANDAVAS